MLSVAYTRLVVTMQYQCTDLFQALRSLLIEVISRIPRDICIPGIEGNTLLWTVLFGNPEFC
jgi:hypothetical protein